jgi:hypothetical protein
MGGWLYVLYLVLPAFGLPLLAVGVVLGLCERSWRKRAGEFGSPWFLGVGLLLSLPVLLALAVAARDWLAR